MDKQLRIIVYSFIDDEGNELWRAHFDGSVDDYKESGDRDEAIERIRSSSPNLKDAEIKELRGKGDYYFLIKLQGNHQYSYYGNDEPAAGGRMRPKWVTVGDAKKFNSPGAAYKKAEQIGRDVSVECRKKSSNV